MKNLVIFLAKSPQNGKIFFLCRIWFSTILSDKILGFSQHCQREAPNSPKLWRNLWDFTGVFLEYFMAIGYSLDKSCFWSVWFTPKIHAIPHDSWISPGFIKFMITFKSSVDISSPWCEDMEMEFPEFPEDGQLESPHAAQHVIKMLCEKRSRPCERSMLSL